MIFFLDLLAKKEDHITLEKKVLPILAITMDPTHWPYSTRQAAWSALTWAIPG